MRDSEHPQNPTRRRVNCGAALLLIIPLGLLCRFAPLGLPYVIVKYGGSFLWAAAVYWFIAFMAARLQPSRIAIIAIAFSAASEFIKRIHSPGFDVFRATFAGKVLLGRHFSYLDIVLYTCAILCAMWIDNRAIHELSASKD
jgi:hypothetical protein